MKKKRYWVSFYLIGNKLKVLIYCFFLWKIEMRQRSSHGYERTSFSGPFVSYVIVWWALYLIFHLALWCPHLKKESKFSCWSTFKECRYTFKEATTRKNSNWRVSYAPLIYISIVKNRYFFGDHNKSLSAESS